MPPVVETVAEPLLLPLQEVGVVEVVRVGEVQAPHAAMAKASPEFLPPARILNGEAQDASQAERIYLDRHFHEIIDLVNSPLSDDELRGHPLIQILLSHGSRPWEDSIQ